MTNQELIKKIKGLKAIKPRVEFKEFSRGILLAQIRGLAEVSAVEPTLILAKEFSWGFYFRTWAEVFSQKVMQPAVALLLMLGLVLGSSLTVNAAFYSLPGDALYPIKISLERTQLALVQDEVSKTELKMEFAKKRVEELDKIVARPGESAQKTKNISLVVNKFKKEVAAVQDHIQHLDQEKKPVFRIALTVDSAATELAQALTENADKLSNEAKTAVQAAADSAEATGISALTTMINSATTTKAELAGNDIFESLTQKIAGLKDKISEADLGAEDVATAAKILAEAEAALTENDFNLVLANIAQVKEIIMKANEIKGMVEGSASEAVGAEVKGDDLSVGDPKSFDGAGKHQQTAGIETEIKVTEEGVATTVEVIRTEIPSTK